MSAQKNVLSGEQDKKMKGDGNSSLPSIGEIKSQSLAPPSTSGKFETNAEKNIDSDKSVSPEIYRRDFILLVI